MGLVRPTFARMYLARAFLAFSGGSLDPRTTQSVVRLWRRRYFSSVESDARNPQSAWLAARATVSGAPAFDAAQLGDGWRPSCMEHAFSTATDSLARLSKPDGLVPDERIEWLKAQDAVFSNCVAGPKPVIPAALPPTASLLARSERSYQIAAAQFYAGQYDDSAKRFGAIARDTASRWAPWGTYLAARSMVRAAAGALDDNQSVTYDSGGLAKAAKLLGTVVAKGGPEQASARGVSSPSYTYVRHPSRTCALRPRSCVAAARGTSTRWRTGW